MKRQLSLYLRCAWYNYWACCSAETWRTIHESFDDNSNCCFHVLVLIIRCERKIHLKMSAISVLWTILSLILLFTCSLAFFSPFWHEHIPDPTSANNSETFIAFGLLRFCLKEQFVTLGDINEWRASKYCSFYKGIFPGIPSVFWKVATIMYALALVLLLACLLLAHISCCRKVICGKSVFSIAGIIQGIAALLLFISLIIYCFGLNSSFAKKHCGSSSGFFNSGTCKIAWGYVLAIVSTALLIFCPMMAHHLSVSTPRKKSTVV